MNKTTEYILVCPRWILGVRSHVFNVPFEFVNSDWKRSVNNTNTWILRETIIPDWIQILDWLCVGRSLRKQCGGFLQFNYFLICSNLQKKWNFFTCGRLRYRMNTKKFLNIHPMLVALISCGIDVHYECDRFYWVSIGISLAFRHPFSALLENETCRGV